MTPHEELERRIERQYAREQAIAAALANHPRNIARMRNVTGLGVGYHYRRGRRTNMVGPVVLVSRKVPTRVLLSRHRIPRSVRVHGRRYRIDVLAVGMPQLLCETGIPSTQHGLFTAVPPGVAICAVDPQTGQIVAGTKGTSGAILEKVATPPWPARYLLTCKHIVAHPNSWAQPWGTNVRGGWVGSSRVYDASVCEMQNYSLDVHCLGTMRPAIPPLNGMKVMKSGAATGVTGSTVTFVAPGGTEVIIDNEAEVPKEIPGVVPPFVNKGDSGSVAMLGTPSDPDDPTVDPFDLGHPIERMIDTIAASSTAADTRDRLRQGFRGRAVSLIYGVSSGQQLAGTPLRYHGSWCRSVGMLVVLADLSAVTGAPVVIATT